MDKDNESMRGNLSSLAEAISNVRETSLHQDNEAVGNNSSMPMRTAAINQQFPRGIPNGHPLAHMPLGSIPMPVPLSVPPGQGIFGHPLLPNGPHANHATQYMAMDPRLFPQSMFFNPSGAPINPFLGGSAANLGKFHRNLMDGDAGLKGFYNGMMLPGPGIPPLPIQRPAKKPRAPSAAAQERRRERNKLLARKTRVKKKAEMDCLRDHVLELLQRNQELREIVRTRLPSEEGERILQEEIQLPDNIRSFVKQVLESRYQQTKSEITGRQHSFCVVDANNPNHPIVYASAGFYELTGYDRDNTLGRNCNFLQGPETDKEELRRFREGLNSADNFTSILLNYRADGSTFWNKIEISSLHGEQGKSPYIIGIQGEISEAEAAAVLSYLRKARNKASEQERTASGVCNEFDAEINHRENITSEDLLIEAHQRKGSSMRSSGSLTPEDDENGTMSNNNSDEYRNEDSQSIPLTSKDLATRDLAVSREKMNRNGIYSVSESSGVTTNGTDTNSADGTSEGDSTKEQQKQFPNGQDVPDINIARKHVHSNGTENTSKGSSDCSSEALSEDDDQ